MKTWIYFNATHGPVAADCREIIAIESWGDGARCFVHFKSGLRIHVLSPYELIEKLIRTKQEEQDAHL